MSHEPRFVFFSPPLTVSPADTQVRPPPSRTRNSNSVQAQPQASSTGKFQAQPQPHSQASTSQPVGLPASPKKSKAPVPQPIVAKGDWTKDLVQLAKTAELKKHALTLQIHTAHILSAHASLDEKGRALEDVREQRNRLDSERKRLIDCLAQINEDRNTADLLEASLERERTQLRSKINTLSAGEYAVAKEEVDRLRRDLGQEPLPSLQETLDGKGNGYLEERRTAAASTPGDGNGTKKRKRTNTTLMDQMSRHRWWRNDHGDAHGRTRYP
ncbi:hypothetical protein HMN09_00703900 [Mycena chlorophos]|uniref:Uncharacterized protein n=1 Tax=Mycena chlorophos TaxID=658473 RepID=A0A8H6SYW7_MYCCL|nr:hypothetical protein HMN09_00703900 [Mycena chlorophos]